MRELFDASETRHLPATRSLRSAAIASNRIGRKEPHIFYVSTVAKGGIAIALSVVNWGDES
jgi:hypothetical protein